MLFDFPSLSDIKDLLNNNRNKTTAVGTEPDSSSLSSKIKNLYLNQVNKIVSSNKLPFVDINKEGIDGASYKLLNDKRFDKPIDRRYLVGQVVYIQDLTDIHGIQKAYLVNIPDDISTTPSYEIFESLLEEEDQETYINNNFDVFSYNFFFPLTIEISNLPASVGDYVVVERQITEYGSSVFAPNLNIFHGRFRNGEQEVEESYKDPEKVKSSFDRINKRYKLNLQTVQESIRVNLSEQSKDLIKTFAGQLTLPSDEQVFSLMGLRPNPRQTPTVKGPFQFHKGIDFLNPEGTPVKAIGAGIVEYTGFSQSGGNIVILKHEKDSKIIFSKYLHLQEILVKKGDQISASQIIAKSGNTGARSTGFHLHIEITDASGQNINPLFVLNGTIKLSTEMQTRYGLSATLTLPLPSGQSINPESQPNISQSTAPVPVLEQSREPTYSSDASPRSIPVTSPKMMLVDFATDFSIYNYNDNVRGSKLIKVREDLYNNLLEIKEILNYFGIPFSTQYLNVSIKNKDLSYLARLGLEFNFNYNATLNPQTNLNFCDYLIAPNFGKSVYNNGYELELWGRVRAIPDNKTFSNYSSEKRELKVYDVSTSYRESTSPKIVELNGTFLNISKILKDYGFYHIAPKYSFFKNSDYNNSNWWIIQSHSRISVGDTYRQLLEKVYFKDNNLAWVNSENKVWNGKMFVDRRG